MEYNNFIKDLSEKYKKKELELINKEQEPESKTEINQILSKFRKDVDL